MLALLGRALRASVAVRWYVFAVGYMAAVKLAAGKNSLCQLSVEERMGCGNGSCNGCVVPVRGGGYIRSCIDGPVFRAEVLAW